MAQHYMHRLKIKKEGSWKKDHKRRRFIKNNVMQQLITLNVENKLLIPHTNVLQPTNEGNDGDDAWMVWS